MRKIPSGTMWELFSEHSQAIEAFESESDRAVSLIVAAFLDDCLEVLLKKCLINQTDVVNEMFSYDRPLGSFSARIKMAYALGHISKMTYNDLNTIRDIRNDFAHHRREISFETLSIRDRIKNLSFPTITKEFEIDFNLSRVKYIQSSSGVMNRIQASERELTNPTWPENRA